MDDYFTFFNKTLHFVNLTKDIFWKRSKRIRNWEKLHIHTQVEELQALIL